MDASELPFVWEVERKAWLKKHDYEPDHWLGDNGPRLNGWAAGGASVSLAWVTIERAMGNLPAISRFSLILGGLTVGATLGVLTGSCYYNSKRQIR